jgi:hypothetical protein
MADFVFDKFKEFLGGAVAVSGTTETVQWNQNMTGGNSTITAALIVGDMAAVGSIVQAVDVSAALTSVAEYAGTGYVRKAVSGTTISVATPVITFNGNPATAWSSLGAASANCDGMLVLWEPGTGGNADGNNVPLFYFDFKAASLDFNGNGGNVTISFSNGMVTLT